jgi:hypothetical protein
LTVRELKARHVQLHDTEANWATKPTFTPFKGEIVVYDIDENYLYERFKIGDGKTALKDLSFCIVDADNIVFNEDIKITTAVGNITIDESGSGVIPSRGKNLKQVFEAIWTQENDPETTLPAVTINTSVQYKEVGTTVTPAYEASLSTGEYTYGPATGITAQSWSVAFGDETKTTASGTFSDIVVTEGNCCNVTATATYNDGAIPVTNLGNECIADKNLQIKAGSASTSKNLIVGYKPNFYGFKTTAISLSAIDSSVVRAFGTNQKQTTAPVKSAKSTADL